MNRKLRGEKTHVGAGFELGPKKEEGGWGAERGSGGWVGVTRVEFGKADEMRRGVEGHIEMGGLGKVNLHLFTDEQQLEQMKHLL